MTDNDDRIEELCPYCHGSAARVLRRLGALAGFERVVPNLLVLGIIAVSMLITYAFVGAWSAGRLGGVPSWYPFKDFPDVGALCATLVLIAAIWRIPVRAIVCARCGALVAWRLGTQMPNCGQSKGRSGTQTDSEVTVKVRVACSKCNAPAAWVAGQKGDWGRVRSNQPAWLLLGVLGCGVILHVFAIRWAPAWWGLMGTTVISFGLPAVLLFINPIRGLVCVNCGTLVSTTTRVKLKNLMGIVR